MVHRFREENSESVNSLYGKRLIHFLFKKRTYFTVMGLAASSGHDNDDLIDKLIDANIVITHRVETALR